MFVLHQKPKKMKASKSKSKASKGENGNFVLIQVNVLGSAGPLRFVVNEDELVAAVIDTALKTYAREGRLPVLGTDCNKFLLYYTNSEFHALRPWDKIGSHGVRNFVLYKKPEAEMTTARTAIRNKGSVSWKDWLSRKSYSKIACH